MTEKQCRYCLVTKPLEQFGKSKRCVDGHRHKCLACIRATRKYDREQNTVAHRIYRAKNGDAYRAYQRAYHRVWDAAHKERRAEQNRKYRARKAAEARVAGLLEFLKQKYVPQ